MDFGQRLRDLRKARGLSLRELATAVGVDFTYLSKVENGKLSPPSEETLRRIARELETDADELVILAGKVPAALARELTSNPQAFEMLRSIANRVYTREEWAEVMREVKKRGHSE